jgi:GWxTD domain-containing protein
MLVSRISTRGEKKSIVPNVSHNVGDLPEGFHIFFEAYNQNHLDSVEFRVTVRDEKMIERLSVNAIQALESGRNQVFIKIDNSSLALGDYSLEVGGFSVHARDTGQAPLATSSCQFVVRWTGVPTGVKDLDLAIDQLQYIAKDSEQSYLKEAATPEEKQKRFLEFWKRKDPNPNTPRNEKMEEYYGKVEYANKHFTHYIEGWRTDMGMVYIIFGSPSNVDRHPFDIDSKPYEVWSYYELNHQFVFVDQTGFGDYRLITPIWEVWQRPRD